MKEFLLFIIFMALAALVGQAKDINKNLDRIADWKIQEAYMKGIEAQPMPVPTTLNKGKEYVIRNYISSDNNLVSNIYPGFGND